MQKRGLPEDSTPKSWKRNRQPNYSADEKSCLLQLVEKYKHVLECKKTDAITSFNKENTWRKLASEFNAVAPNNTQRDAASLKKAYGNIKMNVRKEVADERLEMLKTGGGTAPIVKKNPLQEMALQTMNTKTVYGLANRFDSDNILIDADTDLNEVVHSDSEDCLDIQEIASSSNNWRKWNTQDLKQPLDKSLSNKINEVLEGEAATANLENRAPELHKTKIKSRRRPAALALHSSELSKIYTKLCEERLEVTQLEKTILQNRLESDKKKQEIELEILRTELEIKRQELRKVSKD